MKSMRFEMKMPDLAATESEIRIVRWLVELGGRVKRGQPLVEVETDKATMEVESVASGVLAEAVAAVNESISVGQVIAVLEVEQSAGAGGARGAPAPGGMFARNRAAAVAAETPKKGVLLTLAQRVAGKRLQESKQTIPHFYLQRSVNATAIIARRQAAEPARLAWDAFFVLALARAIARFDRFGCRLDGDELVPIPGDAIGVATDYQNELYVLPIASPAAKSVEQISAALRQQVERLRGGDPEARRIRPVLMTVTNLGVCDVDGFLPIISPPEAAILGVGRVRPTPVVLADGQIGVEPRCLVTLSVDHRIASGRYAAEFLGQIVRELESF
jgi:pyruvate dehydrogenase E2 component (dihydrolipoamide acetyltransferase)